ncbi:hypothetical protein BRC67_02180 [Halobacteriales archaeon QH_3_68_24]|nr:MAG: hypothetical protein BRC67_02180 [Halobacteriales archaeon QH_3_68_24]
MNPPSACTPESSGSHVAGRQRGELILPAVSLSRTPPPQGGKYLHEVTAGSISRRSTETGECSRSTPYRRDTAGRPAPGRRRPSRCCRRCTPGPPARAAVPRRPTSRGGTRRVDPGVDGLRAEGRLHPVGRFGDRFGRGALDRFVKPLLGHLDRVDGVAVYWSTERLIEFAPTPRPVSAISIRASVDQYRTPGPGRPRPADRSPR